MFSLKLQAARLTFFMQWCVCIVNKWIMCISFLPFLKWNHWEQLLKMSETQEKQQAVWSTHRKKSPKFGNNVTYNTGFQVPQNSSSGKNGIKCGVEANQSQIGPVCGSWGQTANTMKNGVLSSTWGRGDKGRNSDEDGLPGFGVRCPCHSPWAPFNLKLILSVQIQKKPTVWTPHPPMSLALGESSS